MCQRFWCVFSQKSHFLWSIISGMPPILKATTGVPELNDSKQVLAKFSCIDGAINISLAEYIWLRSCHF